MYLQINLLLEDLIDFTDIVLRIMVPGRFIYDSGKVHTPDHRIWEALSVTARGCTPLIIGYGRPYLSQQGGAYP